MRWEPARPGGDNLLTGIPLCYARCAASLPSRWPACLVSRSYLKEVWVCIGLVSLDLLSVQCVVLS